MVNFLENYHMVSVEDMIASYKTCMISGKTRIFRQF